MAEKAKTKETADEDKVPDAEGADAEGADAEGQAPAAPERKRLSGKVMVLYIGLPLAILVLGSGGLYFTGLLDGLLGSSHAEKSGSPVKHATPSVFLDMPPMLVNLNSSSKKANYLKLSVALELGSREDMQKVEAVMPRIVDTFQVYLRETRIDDLRGSAGLQRLREELLMRVSAAAQTAQVRDVLFKEMLVQ